MVKGSESPKLVPELIIGLIPMGVLALAFGAWVEAHWMVALTAIALYGLLTGLLFREGSSRLPRLGWANRITLLRAMLVTLPAAALLQPQLFIDAGWTMALVALTVLLLDGLDGYLARTLNEESEFGARFDMEVDAALIFVLCLGLALSSAIGIWVLAIGLMRYAFLAAMVIWPWLSRPLPDSVRRKAVCVWQMTCLVLATTPLFGPGVNAMILASALIALVLSFAGDVAWLYRRRDSNPTASWRMS